MQYEERKTKPESTRKFLIQQVEEQSDLCDVTIKMGYWGGCKLGAIMFEDEKNFHHCVLVASPFFDRVLNDNFLEKQTGKIEMTVGTPVTIEMAVMFLYGKKPKLTKENIESMIDLAEFLLMPNLKSACISWLKTVTITEENCIKFLRLSSFYDFEIPSCNEYLMSHLTEMLQHADTVNLSRDSVQYLFSDRKLSYVSMDDKVTFLMKWTNSHSSVKQRDMRELFGLIDFQNVSKTVLEELKTYHNINKAVDFEKCLSNIESYTPSHRHRVLIMKGENHDGSFWCLDLEREKWFRIKTESTQDGRSYLYYGEISGAKDVGPEIFFKENSYQGTIIAMLNLEEDVRKTYKLIKEEDGTSLRDIRGYGISGDTCVAFVCETVNTNKQTKSEIETRDIQDRIRVLSAMGLPLSQLLALEFMEDRGFRTTEYTDTTTLFTGHLDDEAGNIKLSPVLTFKNEISEICLNKMLTVAILHDSMKMVSFYDLNDQTMETMQLETKYDDKLAESDEGFVVYNENRCICFTRMVGPSISSKFTSKEISLTVEGCSQGKLIFCGNMWYHYYREKEHFILESTSHSELKSNSSVKSVSWRRLPLPKEKCYSSTIDHKLFQISLSKNKLRCDIECPHCLLKPEGRYPRAVSPDYDLGATYYDDSSDDDYYGSVYYYDDSDNYYYDSD